MKAIKDYILDKKLPEFPNSAAKRRWVFDAKKYYVDEGRLMIVRPSGRKGSTGKDDLHLEVVTDENRQVEIMKSLHGGSGKSGEARSLGGHLGMNTVLGHATSRFFWPRMTESVRKFVSCCPECQLQNDQGTLKAKQTLHPVSVPQACWQQIGIDLVGPLTESPEGHKYIMTCIDYFSKWVELFALKSKSAAEVAHNLFKLMCRFGPARIHITDQGREFVNQVSAEMTFLTNQIHRITGACHPQANGLCERQNAATIAALRKSIGELEGDWYRYLDSTAYSYRASRRRATGFKSPFEIMFGRPMPLPIDLRHNKKEDEDLTDAEMEALQADLLTDQMSDEEAREEMFQAAKEVQEAMFSAIAKSIKKEQDTYKAYYDKRHDTEKA